MSELCEVGMLCCFGLSWPMNVIKSYRARSTQGKSLLFLCLILLGYVAGIAAKLTNEEYMATLSAKWYVLAVYVLNFVMVALDALLYARNRRIDREREKKAHENATESSLQ